MGLNAPQRSLLGAFRRSLLGVRITQPAPADEWICHFEAGVNNLQDLWNPSGSAANGDDCICSTYPTGQPNAVQWRFLPSFRWMGWENPPNPAVTITGQQSGAVIQVPVHCCVQDCQPPGPIPWGRYAINFGVTGAAWGVMYPFNYFLGYYDTAPFPFIDGEFADWDILYTPETLPDPGPYSIVSCRAHPEYAPPSRVTIFKLDRPLTYYTDPAIYIQGTGVYDGMHRGYRTGLPSGAVYDPDELSVEVTFAGNVSSGSFQRVFDETWDCHYNGSNPQPPHPPLPPPP